MNNEKIVFNFNSTSGSQYWMIINDIVMGGISNSTFKINSVGTATFSGNLSLDNNGGFASVRAMIEDQQEGYIGIIIRAKGDGKNYNLRFRTDNNSDGYSYQAKFTPINNDWNEYKIPFTDFEPVFRGKTLDNKPLLKSEDIKQVGILIADKQTGYFELNIDWIKFY